MPCSGMGESPFSNNYGDTAEAVLTEYTSNDDIITSSIEHLVAFIPKVRAVLLTWKRL